MLYRGRCALIWRRSAHTKLHTNRHPEHQIHVQKFIQANAQTIGHARTKIQTNKHTDHRARTRCQSALIGTNPAPIGTKWHQSGTIRHQLPPVRHQSGTNPTRHESGTNRDQSGTNRHQSGTNPAPIHAIGTNQAPKRESGRRACNSPGLFFHCAATAYRTRSKHSFSAFWL